MNTTRQLLKLLLPAILGLAFCCQCETTEQTEGVINSLEAGSKFGKFGKLKPVGLKRESGYKFSGVNDSELPSNKSEGAQRLEDTLKNEKVIKNSKGEVIRKEKRDDLYSNRDANTANESSRSFDGNKQAKIKSNKYAKKKFKTPEYLQRQEFKGSKSFKDGDMKASESGSESKRFADKLFKTRNLDLIDKSARENGSRPTGFDKEFKTSRDRTATRAFEKSAIPEGNPGMKGYQDNLNLSMDDVKKLINPASAR